MIFKTCQMLNLLGLIFASVAETGHVHAGSFLRSVPPVPCSQEAREEAGKEFVVCPLILCQCPGELLPSSIF